LKNYKQNNIRNYAIL